MEYPPLPADSPRKPLIERFLALLEVLLVSGLISGFFTALLLSPFFGKDIGLITGSIETLSVFLLLESAITFFFLFILLRNHGETIGNLGLRTDRWKYHLLTGLAVVPLLFSIHFAVEFVFRTYLPEYYLEQNPLTEIIKTPQQLAFFTFLALFAGGLKEELQRAFILNRFRRYLGGAGVGLLVWSLAFGAGHYLQGMQGIVVATLFGLIFGAIYLLSRSMIAPIFAHCVFNLLELLQYYWFVMRQP